MGKITALEFHGIDKKGGLLKECIDNLITMIPHIMTILVLIWGSMNQE